MFCVAQTARHWNCLWLLAGTLFGFPAIPQDGVVWEINGTFPYDIYD